MRTVGDLTPILVFLRDLANPRVGKTGVAAASVTYKKVGAAPIALVTPNLTELAGMPGWYSITPSAGMVDSPGQLGFHVEADDCDPFDGLTELRQKAETEIETSIIAAMPSEVDLAGIAHTGDEMTLTVAYDAAKTAAQPSDLEVTVNPTPVNIDEAALAAEVAPLLPAPVVNPTPVNVTTEEVDLTGIALTTDITAARDNIKAYGDINWTTTVEFTQEQIDALSVSLVTAVGEDLAVEIISGITGSFVFTDAMRLGQGTGSQTFTDVLVNGGNQPISNAVVRAFERSGNTVDFSEVIGRHVSDEDGSYTLFLNPGEYEITVSLRGTQIEAFEITVVPTP